jgi:hypothetical protein
MLRGWRLGLAITLGLGAAGSLLLLVAYSGDYELHSLYRSFVGLWVNAVVIGYIVGWPLFPMLAADVEQLTPAMEPADRSIARTELSEAWSNRGVWVARGIGVICGMILSAQAGVDALERRPGYLAYAWVPVVVPLLWATILPALWRLIRMSLFVRRLGGRVRIDLSDPHLLGAFADIGIRHLLVIIVGLSVIPMQAILTGQIATVDFVPALVVTVPVALMVLLLPMWGIRGAVITAKRIELDRLNELATASEHDSDRHMLLSLYRRQIADTSEWPASAGAASRLLFYVVIPPLAWIAAALVQNLVSNVLGLR